MFLKNFENRFKWEQLKEDLRKIGVNLATAGIVGVFMQHMVGADFSIMFWTSLGLLGAGFWLILMGIRRKEE